MNREVLVVLGAPNTPSGALSDISKGRLDCCKNLFVKGKLILCTGGWGSHFNTSANAHASYAKEYLIKNGLSEDDFLEFALSKNTVDDAVKVQAVLSNVKNATLTIITSDYHLERVKLIFNEILCEYCMKFVGVESHLPDVQHKLLLQHEKEAIESILLKGLYY